MFIDYASNSEGPFDISCGCRLLVWLFLRIEFLGKPELITDWNMSLCILPALKAAEIAKFMALLDRRGRIWMIREINVRVTIYLKSLYLRF